MFQCKQATRIFNKDFISVSVMKTESPCPLMNINCERKTAKSRPNEDIFNFSSNPTAGLSITENENNWKKIRRKMEYLWKDSGSLVISSNY